MPSGNGARRRSHRAQRLVRHRADSSAVPRSSGPLPPGPQAPPPAGPAARAVTLPEPPAMVLASARAEISGRQARVQSRLGIEQKRPRNRHLLTGFKAPHHRVELAAARPKLHLHSVKHPGHALDEDHFLRAAVDDRRSRHGQNLPRGSKRDNPRLSSIPPQALHFSPARSAVTAGCIGHQNRTRWCSQKRRRHPRVLVDRAVPRNEGDRVADGPGRCTRGAALTLRAAADPAASSETAPSRQTGALNLATTGHTLAHGVGRGP